MKRTTLFDRWLDQVQKLAGEHFEYWSDWYSWRAAHDDGMTPEQAVSDCRAWMTS